LEAARASDADRQSHQQSASATSGTYVPALDVGLWRADSERIARCVIADAAYVVGTDEDEE
jgi:hypothetical protein